MKTTAVATRRRVTLLCILGMALGLRIARLDAAGLWIDEKHTLLNQKGLSVFGEATPGQVFSEADFASLDGWGGAFRANTVDNGGNGLAYLMLVRAWAHFAGPRDFSLRFLSVLFGILTVFWGYLLARRTTSSRRAILGSSLLLAVFPLLVRQGQEARSYSMAAALGAVSTYLFLSLLQRRRGIWWTAALWGVSNALLFFTHFFGVVVLFSQIVFAGVFVRDRSRARAIAVGTLLVALAIACWLSLGGTEGLSIAARNSAAIARGALQPNSPESPTPARLGAGSLYLLLQLLGNHLVAFGLRVRLVAPLLVAPLALLWLVWRERRLASRRTREALTLSFLHVAVAVGFAVLFSMRAGHISAFHPKYSIAVVPAAAILLAAGLDRALAPSRSQRPLWLGVAGLQAVVLAVSLSSVYLCTQVLPPWPPQRQANPYHDVAAAVEAPGPDGETTVECPRLVDAKIIHVLLEGRGDPRYTIKSPAAEDAVVIHRGGHVIGRYSLAGLRY